MCLNHINLFYNIYQLQSTEFVSKRTAKRTARKIGALCYLECSSKELQGVNEVAILLQANLYNMSVFK